MIPNWLLEMTQHKVWAAHEPLVQAMIATRRQSALDLRDDVPAPKAAEPTLAAGVAVIRVQGMIWPKANLFTRYLGDTALDELRAQVRQLASDPNVSAIVLDIDSPGGIAEGLMETAEVLRQAREQKRLLALADSLCASAAYYLAAQASPGDLVVTSDSKIGSVGSYILHIEFSKMLEMAGITATIIRNPDRKARLNELETLDDQAFVEAKAFVDLAVQQFHADVAKGRGIPVSNVVRDFGAGALLPPQEAISVGMADRQATLEQVLSKLVGRKGGTRAEGDVPATVAGLSDGSRKHLDRIMKQALDSRIG
jgi:ClpP class serine protease